MRIEFPEIAGGYVPGATLANGDFAKRVRGCKVLKSTGGFYTVTLDQPVLPLGRIRAWAQNMGALIPWNIVVSQDGPSALTIRTYRLIFDTPNVALQLDNYNFSFGVSVVPE